MGVSQEISYQQSHKSEFPIAEQPQQTRTDYETVVRATTDYNNLETTPGFGGAAGETVGLDKALSERFENNTRLKCDIGKCVLTTRIVSATGPYQAALLVECRARAYVTREEADAQQAACEDVHAEAPDKLLIHLRRAAAGINTQEGLITDHQALIDQAKANVMKYL
ncbi:MAG: hypothetical protein JWO07_453 [Candidatus Saccharibacteria bacterium]|nr:hypothetical protein [Candidatus Saccharibacteria bacterium]